MSVLFQLFWSFCQIGFTSFGGMSMVPLINDEMVSHGWMNVSEVSDIIAIAEMTPGPLGLNCATFAGMRVAGILGAIISVLGVLAPTFTLCALAAVFFEKFKKLSGSLWEKHISVISEILIRNDKQICLFYIIYIFNRNICFFIYFHNVNVD